MTPVWNYDTSFNSCASNSKLQTTRFAWILSHRSWVLAEVREVLPRWAPHILQYRTPGRMGMIISCLGGKTLDEFDAIVAEKESIQAAKDQVSVFWPAMSPKLPCLWIQTRNEKYMFPCIFFATVWWYSTEPFPHFAIPARVNKRTVSRSLFLHVWDVLGLLNLALRSC